MSLQEKFYFIVFVSYKDLLPTADVVIVAVKWERIFYEVVFQFLFGCDFKNN